jgi:hypothetical protein
MEPTFFYKKFKDSGFSESGDAKASGGITGFI